MVLHKISNYRSPNLPKPFLDGKQVLKLMRDGRKSDPSSEQAMPKLWFRQSTWNKITKCVQYIQLEIEPQSQREKESSGDPKLKTRQRIIPLLKREVDKE